MSQSGPLEGGGSGPLPPEVATQYDADVGFAVPVGNILNLFTSVSPAGATPIQSQGAGDTITTSVQIASAIAAPDATRIGLAAFNSTDFTVDLTGFVSLAGGGGSSILSIEGDDGFDVVPDGGGIVYLLGNTVANATNAQPVYTHNGSDNFTEVIDVQVAAAVDSGAVTINDAGLASFDNAYFSVNPATGFVTLPINYLAGIDVQATSGGGTNPAVVDPFGNITLDGAVVAAGTNPLRTVSTAPYTVQVQAQYAQAIAASDATKVGLCNFDSSDFSVDANGFVSLFNDGPFVESVSGTLNRITSTGGVNPVIDIDAGYVGQASITTLGTIGTGTWQGTAVGPIYGGTGQTSYLTGDILYASAANTLSKLPAAVNGQVLTLAAGIPSWATPTTGTVTSVSGTANRITSTGGNTPVIDIAATYVGQTSLTTLGTITTGTWNATTITLHMAAQEGLH